MAHDYARIKASIWSDSDFAALPASVQRVYLVIVSQSELSLCGIIQPSPKRWARYATDTPIEDVQKAILVLEEHRFTVSDDDTDELLIRSFVRHDLALGSPNAVVGLSKAYEAIHSKVLRKVLMEELHKVEDHKLLSSLTRYIPDGDQAPSELLCNRVTKVFLKDWMDT
jgi:hypothetical protein